MTVEEIVRIMSSITGRHLVSRREIRNTEGVFKGIKECRIGLWEVGNTSPLILISRNLLLTKETRESSLHSVEIEFTEKLLEYFYGGNE